MGSNNRWRTETLQRIAETGDRRSKGGNPAVGLIPDALNASMRERLRMIRTTKGMSIKDVQCISPGTVTTYETEDISTMKLGILYALALELGEDFTEFMSYLIGEEDSGEMTPAAKNTQRMTILMRGLSLDEQAFLLDMVTNMVDYMVGHRSKRRGVSTRSSREVLTAATSHGSS